MSISSAFGEKPLRWAGGSVNAGLAFPWRGNALHAVHARFHISVFEINLLALYGGNDFFQAAEAKDGELSRISTFQPSGFPRSGKYIRKSSRGKQGGFIAARAGAGFPG